MVYSSQQSITFDHVQFIPSIHPFPNQCWISWVGWSNTVAVVAGSHTKQCATYLAYPDGCSQIPSQHGQSMPKHAHNCRPCPTASSPQVQWCKSPVCKLSALASGRKELAEWSYSATAESLRCSHPGAEAARWCKPRQPRQPRHGSCQHQEPQHSLHCFYDAFEEIVELWNSSHLDRSTHRKSIDMLDPWRVILFEDADSRVI